ncbi:MAG: DUF3833 domain-containing protein [Desulfopila sp.]
MRNIAIVVFLGLTATFAGCSSIDMGQYSTNGPRFDVFEYFQGYTRGWGIVQDRKGRLLRQFVVDIEGHTNANGALVMEENFRWNDGELSERTWIISTTTANDSVSEKNIISYRGRAADVIDTAQGTAAGNVLNWSYVLDLEVDGKTWEISFDDWMFLQPDDILINKAVMTKFGFQVGEITIVFAKTSEGPAIDTFAGKEIL